MPVRVNQDDTLVRLGEWAMQEGGAVSADPTSDRRQL
jgi:hypothetical protein